MSSTTKGCWSCRARRKRCDGRTPHCDTCDRLGIDCAGFGTARPSWGGTEQRAYCGWYKNVIKSARRQQIHVQTESYSGSSSELSQAQQSQQWLTSRISPVTIVAPETAPHQVTTSWTDPEPSSTSLEVDPSIQSWLAQPLDWETDLALFFAGLDERDLGALGWTAFQASVDLSVAEGQQYQPPPLSPRPDMPDFPASSQGNAGYEPDWLLLMRYFDCTMQRLFPFHCPGEHVDGMGYLLQLAHHSSMVRTALMSAVSYELERQRTDAQPQRPDSKTSFTTPKWLAYYHRASEMIRSRLETLFNHKTHSLPGFRHNLAVETLVSLVHLNFLGLAANDNNATDTRSKQGCQILELLGSETLFQAAGPQFRVQAFFTSVFLRWLVFRHTARPQEPPWSRLAETLQRLPNDNLCGYATSLLEAISQIADLAAWKTSSAAAGVLSTLELAQRAHDIEASVAPFVEIGREQPLDDDDKIRSVNRQNCSAVPPLALAQYYHQGCCCCLRSKANATTTATITPTCPLHAHRQTLANALLARSAQIFLYIVVSGPNPRLPEIQAAVRSGVRLLRQWEKNREIMGHMALSWPLAVMTSMAVGIEERQVLSSAATACKGMWAYPDEHQQVETEQAPTFQLVDFY